MGGRDQNRDAARPPGRALAWGRRRLRLWSGECPACGEGASVAGFEPFEDRGLWPGSDDQVLRCRNCGVGVRLQRTPGVGLVRASLVDADAWSKFEAARADADVPADEPAPVPAQDQSALVHALSEAGIAGEQLAHLVAESLFLRLEDAVDLVLRTTGERVAFAGGGSLEGDEAPRTARARGHRPPRTRRYQP